MINDKTWTGWRDLSRRPIIFYFAWNDDKIKEMKKEKGSLGTYTVRIPSRVDILIV